MEIIDQELFAKNTDSLKSAELFLSGFKYTYKYHFSKKVKSTKVEGATFSLCGKTMTYQVDFVQMLKDPKSIVVEVGLEN